jgi:FemAB-related protein (PEP-CTERM system-associated)
MNAVAPSLATRIRAADLADRAESARIDGFVLEHPGSAAFHRPQWSLAVERGTSQRAHFLVAERGGAITGCLPLTHVRSRLFGDALSSAGFATGGGILCSDAETAQALADEARGLATRARCPAIELRGGPRPGGWEEQNGIYANFGRPLPADESALLLSIPRRQRAEIRRALQFPLEISVGRDARHRDAHYRVYAESVRNLGTPVFPRRLFDAALNAFAPDEADIIVVWHAGRPQATLLAFYHKGVCQPFWGGGTAEGRQWRANDLVWFELMRRAIGRGCTAADFGRSKVGTGPWRRKRIWDFEETPLSYWRWTQEGRAVRDINPMSAKYRIQVAAWQRMPLWLANRAGPLIARGLG